MSNFRSYSYFTLLLFAACSNGSAAAESPQAVMDGWVGTWDVEVTLKKSIVIPEEMVLKGTETTEWILNKAFLQTKQSLAGGAFKKLSLMRYEPNEGVFLFWDFDSKGSFPMGITSGKWDQAKGEIALSGEYLGGASGEGVVRLEGDDEVEVAFTVRSADGTVLIDIEAKAERSK